MNFSRSTFSCMDDYQYSPLDTQKPSFRLLILQKADTVEIRCKIFHAVISDHDAVPYEALSYTWGSTELLESVEVDGQRLWITENLYSALHCLRSGSQDRVLWIDAVCINQTDKKEQSQQVLEMGKIFGFAARVIFWLGKPTADAMLLMNSLDELHRKSFALSHGGAKTDCVTWKTLWSSIQPVQEPQRSDQLARRRRGLETLLKRPWFRRVWILQEVFNAQAAIVCSGVLSVPADVFALAPSLLDFSPDDHVQSILDIIPRSATTDPRHSREKDNLNDLLLKFGATKATDNRDMIFALLAMSSEPFEHQLLRPDYTKALHEVIYNTIHYWVEATTTPISQVLNCLVGFKESIRVTYLVFLEDQYGEEEVTESGVVRILSQSDEARCRRDASMFKVESSKREVTGEQEAFHTELDRLQLEPRSYKSPFLDDVGFRIISWKASQGSTKLVIVKDTKEAILQLSSYQSRQVFDFIADRSTDDVPKLLIDLLHRAIDEGDYDAVQFLLEKGADVNARGQELEMVLYRAIDVKASLEAIRLLIENGADIDAQGGGYGTALNFASRRGYFDIVQLLIENGADVNAQGGFSSCGRPFSAVQLASEGGHLEVLKLLIKAGADVNAGGGRAGNALAAVAAVLYLPRPGYLQVVQLLVEQGANVNARGGVYGTALQAASIAGQLEIVHFLLDKGADVNDQGGMYGSALKAALETNRADVVQLLLKYGAVDVEPRQGEQ